MNASSIKLFLRVLLPVFIFSLLSAKNAFSQEVLDDSYYRAIITEVSEVLGVSTEFTVKRFNDSSKSAAFADFGPNGEQVININDAFSAAMSPSQYGDAPWKFTIAHEIGHFQNGHISKTNLGTVWFGLITRRKIELQADYFGGFVMALLGATKEETTSYFHLPTIDFSSGFFSLYPPVEDRKSETERGWNAGAQRLVTSVAEPNSTENTNNSSVSGTCQTDNTGDYCFQNLSAKEVDVVITFNNRGVKSAKVLIGQTKCFFSMESAVYEFSIRVDGHKIDYGDLLVQQCKSETYVIH